MIRYLGTAIAVLALLALLADSALGASPARTCFEDEPCWNWATMGNHKRGVVTTDGTPLVVGPCRFARMWERGRLRYSVRFNGRTYVLLERLKGDGWARRHGCRAHAHNLPQ